ncbi:MAG TPA: isocitrate lyase/PEP mutase family protein [Xanthobacteraceae bacterium]|nr:isocitrate lyase/PEP mutase family protein [Xanthobacteraceae bacterium]
METIPRDEAGRKRRHFRDLLARPSLLVMPGGFSPVYARMAQAAGYESFFLAGSQMSGFLLGVPDSGVLGLRDVVDHARHVAAACEIPILLDADTGFGNAVNVHYAVQEIVRCGVAGLQIEDQEAPKKSGTLGGRRCITTGEAVGKIRAAVAARDEIDPSFVIAARCDAIGADGISFAEVVERCVAYGEAGADLVWLNAVETRDQLAQVCRATPRPVLCNWWSATEPWPSLEEYAALGARVALFPTIASMGGLQGAWDLLNDFRAHGPQAQAAWRKRAAASPYGAADYRRFTGHDRVAALERDFVASFEKSES